ncbi:MAG TPA: hypothetical protein VI299_26900 [Polyangiales bacterium]
MFLPSTMMRRTLRYLTVLMFLAACDDDESELQELDAGKLDAGDLDAAIDGGSQLDAARPLETFTVLTIGTEARATLSGTTTGKLLISLDGGPGRVFDLTTVPPQDVATVPSAGQLLANGSLFFDYHALYDTSTSVERHRFPQEAAVYPAEDGSRFLQIFCTGNAKFNPPRVCNYELVDADGRLLYRAPAAYSDSHTTVVLSPDGKSIVHSFVANDRENTEIYRDGELTGRYFEKFVRWLDADHVLLKTYQPTDQGGFDYAGYIEVDVRGNLTRSLGMPADGSLDDLIRIDDHWFLSLYNPERGLPWIDHTLKTSIWSRDENRIVGSKTTDLQSEYRGVLAVAGPYIVLQRSADLIAIAWR